jgi:hypothetical protein
MDQTIFPADKAMRAFTNRKLVRIRKLNGKLLEPGYIIIMYGDIAFRMQPRRSGHESQFIRMAEIKDIVIEEN